LKGTFSEDGKPQFVKFGSARDNDNRCDVKAGKLKLQGAQVAELFKPSLDAVSEAFKGIAGDLDPEKTFVFLVGGFAGSPWLFKEIGRELAAFGLKLSRPDTQTNKAVAFGAVLYHLQGPQTGEFLGIPVSGRSINVLGGERMVFDKDGLLGDLISVEEIALVESQLQGTSTTPGGNTTGLLVNNPQTSPDFRSRSRRAMASIHENFNAGHNGDNAKLVAKDVQINADWVISSGPDAFVNFVGTWKKSFPGLVYHDDNVIADGHLGAVEFVWEGMQTGNYTALNGTVLPPSGQAVRVRGFIFLEFGDDGLITKVTGVHNEGIIEDQLNKGYLYP